MHTLVVVCIQYSTLVVVLYAIVLLASSLVVVCILVLCILLEYRMHIIHTT